MIFNKLAVLVLLVVSSAAAEDHNLRSRKLTVCPVDRNIELRCTVLKKEDGEWINVGEVKDTGTLELENFDPEGCYNVFCESNDTGTSKHIQFEGSFKTPRKEGFHRAWKEPFYLSGRADGDGCSSLAHSCEDLAIKVQARRSPPLGEKPTDEYLCAELMITCKPSCFDCPGDLVPLTDCPADKHDCGCPDKEIPVGNDKCELCKDGEYYEHGECVPKCPWGQKLDGSGYCIKDWCHYDYQCPYNSHRKKHRECYNNFDDCECKYGYYKHYNKCKPHYWCWW